MSAERQNVLLERHCLRCMRTRTGIIRGWAVVEGSQRDREIVKRDPLEGSRKMKATYLMTMKQLHKRDRSAQELFKILLFRLGRSKKNVLRYRA